MVYNPDNLLFLPQEIIKSVVSQLSTLPLVTFFSDLYFVGRCNF